MIYSELLPIGTVVKLVGIDQLTMILGYCKKEKKKKNTYVYEGTIYPIGTTIAENTILFNPTVIDTIYFKGFETNLFEDFKINLQESLKEDL